MGNYRLMRKVYSIVILLLLALTVISCVSTPPPLKLRRYKKNIVVNEKRHIFVEGDRIDFNKFRSELVSKMVFEQTPVVVHFHHKLSQDAFDVFVEKMKAEGFSKFECVLYGD